MAHRIPRGAQRAAGFTLLELVVVVTVIAILAALAISSYGFAIRKTRRSAAQGCMTEAAQFMERFYSTNLNYTLDRAGTAVVLPRCTADVVPHYTVRFVAGEPTAGTFALEAIPQGAQVRDACGTMTLNHTGRRTPEVDCW